METLFARPVRAGQTSPQGGSGAAALRGPKKLRPECNAPDRPTSVWSLLAREHAEPSSKKELQMTASPEADASFAQPKDWSALNWMAIRQQVRRLQVRIAKAVKDGDRRRASA